MCDGREGSMRQVLLVKPLPPPSQGRESHIPMLFYFFRTLVNSPPTALRWSPFSIASDKEGQEVFNFNALILSISFHHHKLKYNFYFAV